MRMSVYEGPLATRRPLALNREGRFKVAVENGLAHGQQLRRAGADGGAGGRLEPVVVVTTAVPVLVVG